ncbi:MAG TPA: hypothetical protein VFA52_04515 [Candidatus Paceibacterota bacterium]|jgi:3-mercaptopyruvate sulfurtransferase SseA|nr:hypothetical protein [Candidatus Paceibacterota bacterium]
MKDCYDIPAIYAKHRYNWTTEEKILDTMLQKEYRGKAEEMIIPITKGKHAGAVNHEYTDMLLGVLVQVEGQIDWFATYEMRRKLRDAIVKKQKGG